MTAADRKLNSTPAPTNVLTRLLRAVWPRMKTPAEPAVRRFASVRPGIRVTRDEECLHVTY